MISKRNFALLVAIGLSQPLFAQVFNGTKEIAKRQFPWISDKIELRKLETENNKEIFQLSTSKNKVLIEASSESAASRGLDWYVKHYLHQSISHLGDNKYAVKNVPKIEAKIRKESFVP